MKKKKKSAAPNASAPAASSHGEQGYREKMLGKVDDRSGRFEPQQQQQQQRQEWQED